MVRKALVLMADGCEEIETVTVIDILRRASIAVTVAGLTGREVQGANGIRLLPDTSIDHVRSEDFDLLILPGGSPGVERLRKDRRVLDALHKASKAGKKIAAICAAPLVLEDAGMLAGKKATSYPSVRADLHPREYSQEPVVVDGDLITSRAPGTALRFSLKLVEELLGKEKSEEISRATLAFDQR